MKRGDLMLPTKPESILAILINSFKTYKKTVAAVYPISFLLFFMHFIARELVMTGKFWMISISFLFLLLSFFCFCWGIYFTYNFIENNRIGYIDSFKDTLKRVLRAISLFGIGIIFIIGIAFFAITLQGFISIETFIFKSFYAAFVIVLFVPILCFILISILETLIKDASFLAAIQKAIQVSFSLESSWRFLSFFLILLLFIILVFIPALLLVHLLSLFKLEIVVLVTV